MFRFLKWTFIGLLTSLTNASKHTKCASLGNQISTTQSTLINSHHNDYIPGLHHYSFAVDLNRCVRSCNALNNLSNKVYIPSNTGDLNLSLFNMIKGINESKALTKYISFKRKYKFHGKNYS